MRWHHECLLCVNDRTIVYRWLVPRFKELYSSQVLKKKSDAIGYVTSNFIGQLHLHVRVNFTFYLVGTVSEYCFEVTHIKFVIRII